MRKLLVVLPLLLMSCTQKELVSENSVMNDSAIVSNETVNKIDSAASGDISIDEEKTLKETFKKDRVVEANNIIETIDAKMIPITISDEFTNSDQQMIVKIKNFNRNNIVGKITPKNSKMNIRFNQIKLPNGDYDGSFSRDIKYNIKESGEIWLIIGKSLMASGDAIGKFKVNLE